jgi:methylated-DNA-[protein]-cysteine S-methyltransferase
MTGGRRATYASIDTPTGPFAVVRREQGELGTVWLDDDDRLPPSARRDPGLEPELVRRLERYFDGEDVAFDDVPLAPGGAFFRRCWDACRRIPRGRTQSYGALARAAGSPAAPRAVGQAMRRNPLPIIVPCHRVVSAGGGIGGFCGTMQPDADPLARKRWLLAMEGVPSPASLFRA